MSDPRVPDPDGVWLGLDLGAGHARCAAVDGTGRLLATAVRPLTGRRTGKRHEQDPEQWWTALSAACREALDGLDPRRIRGLAVAATSGTILLADADGTPLTPGLMYDDGRAAEQAAAVDEAGGAVWRQLGYGTMPATWALPRLRWLLDRTPGREAVAGKGVRLLHQADLITWRLAGHQVASDSSHALKTGYHLIEERWPDEVLDRLDVPEGLLPEVVRPGTVLGTVCAAAAGATGIPEGTAVVAGMTDGCAAQIGAGALAPGAWHLLLGTTFAVKGSSPHLVRDPAGVVHCHRAPGGNWLPGGASGSGAGVISPYFHGANLDALTERAAALDPDAIVYPLISTDGESFPFRAPDAEPFLLGEVPHRAAEFHAYLLGAVCLERLSFDYLDLLGAPVGGPLIATGEGTRNPYWCRLRADVLGRPVHLPEQSGSALGMAVLAAATSAGAGLDEAAAAMVRTGEEIRPRAARTARYLPAYLRFVAELTRRGWLAEAVADHARDRAGR
ncbi:FGGY-family carbohydrate kinase [Streptomyces sp. x-80]|uniref:FGGY-family carbohydrate kinase n=1 Tax=Streptomyces sp. x-80 TaxID=2789282 RepID=UPI00397F1123